MARIQTVLDHIELRERVFGIRYNLFQRSYGFIRTLFHPQLLVEGANAGLRKQLGDK